jgi:outer membrane protein assembly factor BamB
LTQQKRIPLWPVVAIVLLVASYVIPMLVPEAFLFGLLGGLVGALLVAVWWLLFSRAPWLERLLSVLLMAMALAATKPFLHVSIATAGQGNLFYIFAIPLLALGLAVWAIAARRLEGGARWASMIATLLLASAIWTLLRTGGVTGDGQSDFAWRWSPTPEDRLLAQAGSEPAPLHAAPAKAESPSEDAPPAPAPTAAETAEPNPSPAAPAEAETPEMPIPARAPEIVESSPPVPDLAAPRTEADWPGFRGPARDGVIPGLQIETDWTKSPPVELWRRPIGPGWSSFAVAGDFLYTQEQRGDEEIVASYDGRTGEPVWMHSDPVRFYESNGGAGPRGTPSLSGGRLYAFGATGILNALDARDGSVLWSRNVASDSDMEVPGWGFASSPLVVDGVVIVAAGGKLVAYDLGTGEPRWFGPKGGGGYSSPHLVTIDGVEQVLLQNAMGAISLDPVEGMLLWEHAWPGFRIVQPTAIADGDLLISSSDAMGGIATRRITVAREAGRWNAAERWTSKGLKPYFNDMVVHQGHAFGFDGRILSCIDLADGTRKWKGGRFGHGQLVLLRDQGLLLVLSEEGELALVEATPDEFREGARFKAIDGKTWNHPVLVGNLLLVRNGEEMAAFRLSLLST